MAASALRRRNDGDCNETHQVTTDVTAPEFARLAVMTATSDLNLTPRRAEDSVWNRRGWDGTPERMTLTRLLLGVGGGVLAIQGLRQRSVMGSFFTGLGGTLAWWALTGESDLSDARRWFGELYARITGDEHDVIARTSDESFPASDAPSWTPAVGTGARRPKAVQP